MRIAKGTQKPGQTKEQTKLIAAGIEKGIAEYKKQHKAKSRQLDKQKKQKTNVNVAELAPAEVSNVQASNQGRLLPWLLLGLSWAGFVAYLLGTGTVSLP